MNVQTNSVNRFQETLWAPQNNSVGSGDGSADSLYLRPKVDKGQDISQLDTASKAHRSPKEIRDELIIGLFKSYSLDVLGYPYPNAKKALALMDHSLRATGAASRIGQALKSDLQKGDKSLSAALEETKYQLVDILGKEAALYLMKQLISKNPPAAVLATVLGPELLDAVIYDLPVILNRVAEVTGFHIENGRPRFDWKTYNPHEDPPIRFVERGREFATKVGDWGHERLPDFIEFLDNFAAKIRRFRDWLLD